MKKIRVALILVLTAASRAAESAPDVLPPQAEVVFADSFEKPELDPVWKVKVGEWKVADGALHARGPDAFLLLERNAGTSMRLEYTAWSDDPCDLSACLNLDAAAAHPAGVFFQFGGMLNQVTGLSYGKARLWEGTAPRIEKGVRYRVVCERWGAFARFALDGKVLSHGVIPDVEPGGNAFAGFFIYKSGCIDDVKLYRFRGDPAGEILKAEPELKERTWLGFEDGTQLPAGWSLEEGAGTARVVPLRDYRNSDPLPRWVEDHCLELASTAAGGVPRLEGSFAGQERGLLEFEALADPTTGSADTGFELALLDTSSQPAAVLATDPQHRFYTRGPDGVTVLEPVVAYTGINPRPPLRFPQGRWLRVRLHYDATAAQFTAAIVSMYVPERSYNAFPATGHWFVFGKDLPFTRAAAGGRIAGLRLAFAGHGRLRVDNVYAIAPTNGLTVCGKDIRKPARDLLGTPEHPRHDPLDLFLYSLRETLGTQGQYGEQAGLRQGKAPEVLEAAFAYNELLVECAYREVEARALRRARYALQTRGKAPAAKIKEAEESAAMVETVEGELAVLYRAYLDAYLDSLNSARMTREVTPAAAELRGRLQGVRERLTRAQNTLGLSPLPDPGQPDVRLDKGRYRTAAGPAFHFPQTNWLFWPEQDRLLRLDGCATIYGSNFLQAPEGSFVNGTTFERYVSYFVGVTPAARFLIADIVGLHGCNTMMPDWWLAKNAADDDVFFCDATGRVPLKGAKRWEADGRAQLNFWNETVQSAMKAMASERARYFARKWPGRVMAWEVLQEAHSGAGFAQTGYNASARSAFRKRLRQAYGTIAALNQRWGATYQDFTDIQPPEPNAPVPSALNYEFQRFRQEAYRDWIAAYLEAVQAELPDVPAVNRIVDIVPYPTDHTWSFDFTVLYPIFDYFEFHTSMGERLRLSDRMMVSLKRVFGGESAVMEWGLGSAGELFDERGARRATEAEFFRLAAGGRSLFNVWYGTCPGWGDCANWTDPRWSHTTLRYSAASIPVSILRLRRFERWLLDYPQVVPRLSILESNSSFLNAAPTHGPRSRLVLGAQTLEAGGYDYGFPWEDLVLTGKQDLTTADALLLPCATCLAEPFQERLQTWLAAGGRAAAIAPPGVFDSWGRPSGKLLSAVFPGVEWAQPKPGEWEPRGAVLPAKESAHPVLGDLYRGHLGKGELLVFSKVDNNARPAAEPALLAVVKRLLPHQLFSAARNRFELTLRRDDRGRRYVLTALNGDLAAPAEDEVRLRLPVRLALDVEIGLELPLRHHGEESVLPLALAPGEGVVIELRE
jgi:hypothetical protein